MKNGHHFFANFVWYTAPNSTYFDVPYRYQNGLHEYARAVIARMQAENLMNVKDPRSEYEQISAENLQSLVDLNWSEVIRFNPGKLQVCVHV